MVSFVQRAEPGTPSVAFERRSADFSNQLTIQPKPSHSRPSSGSAKALVLFLRCWVTSSLYTIVHCSSISFLRHAVWPECGSWRLEDVDAQAKGTFQR
ncbi:hypothetical protein CN171_23110 [Sinorhizobium meliloti]|nr:hypothetical protein CN171_23110 [Sinorhizobium meliloti]